MRGRLTELFVSPLAASYALARARGGGAGSGGLLLASAPSTLSHVAAHQLSATTTDASPPTPPAVSTASASTTPPSSPDASLLALARAMATMHVAPSSGLLLWGPSGCGKTALARSLARVAGVRLLHIQCPRLLSRYVGDSEAGIRAVFRAARAAAPCLLLLDDIDCIAGRRGGGGGGRCEGRAGRGGMGGAPRPAGITRAAAAAAASAAAAAVPAPMTQDSEGEEEGNETDDAAAAEDVGANDVVGLTSPPSPSTPLFAADAGGGRAPAPVTVLDRMLASLLNELDGVGHAKGEGPGARGQSAPAAASAAAAGTPLLHSTFVLVVGTTNLLNALDPAVLRPGRLEHHVHIGPPSADDVRAILRLATASLTLHADVDLAALAGALAGRSCAAVRGVAAQAAMGALRDHAAAAGGVAAAGVVVGATGTEEEGGGDDLVVRWRHFTHVLDGQEGRAQ